LKEAREKSDGLEKKYAELQRKYEDCKRHYIELKHKNGEAQSELSKLKGESGGNSNRNEQSANSTDKDVREKYELLKGKYKVDIFIT
jgi:phage shock protein A